MSLKLSPKTSLKISLEMSHCSLSSSINKQFMRRNNEYFLNLTADC